MKYPVNITYTLHYFFFKNLVCIPGERVDRGHDRARDPLLEGHDLLQPGLARLAKCFLSFLNGSVIKALPSPTSSLMAVRPFFK